MAQTIVTTDDLDGAADARPRSFALNGQEYTIDLTDANYKKLEEALAPFIAAGHRAGGRPARSNASTGTKSRAAELKKIREWAADNGHSVSERGRVPQTVIDAYEAAN